ncbi:MAG: DUF4421 family protein [Bacteroidales bacterium]|nr:DUF4421 family protein [Bacteroidales bacterium]
MKKALIVSLLLLAWVPGRCQFFRNVDDWLMRRQARQVYDTTYIYRPQTRWLVRTKSFFFGENITLIAGGGEAGANGYGFRIGNGFNYKQTIGGGYRNLAFDVGFMPFGKRSSADFSIKVYGNRIGVKAEGALCYGFSGRATALGHSYDVKPGDVVAMYGMVNAYYAFNGGRFSMPAAMTQSYFQRRSAGSLLAVVSVRAMPVTVLDEAIREMQMERAFCALAGAGLGYGYNWVPSRHWLVHACLNETVGIWNAAAMSIQGYEKEFRRESPIFVTAGSFALLYYYRKWYFGMYADFDNMLFLGEDKLSMIMGRTKSSANLTVGIRF